MGEEGIGSSGDRRNRPESQRNRRNRVISLSSAHNEERSRRTNCSLYENSDLALTDSGDSGRFRAITAISSRPASPIYSPTLHGPSLIFSRVFLRHENAGAAW